MSTLPGRVARRLACILAIALAGCMTVHQYPQPTRQTVSSVVQIGDAVTAERQDLSREQFRVEAIHPDSLSGRDNAGVMHLVPYADMNRLLIRRHDNLKTAMLLSGIGVAAGYGVYTLIQVGKAFGDLGEALTTVGRAK